MLRQVIQEDFWVGFLDFGKITEEMGNAKAGGTGGFLVFSHYMRSLQRFGTRPECILRVRQDRGGNGKC